MFFQKTPAKKVCQTFFDKLNVEGQVTIGKVEDKTLPIRLQVTEPRQLIGQSGQVLADIQHVLRLVARKADPEIRYVDLDINSYKEKKASYLKELAQQVADEVALVKKPKELPAMSSYDRRIIHMALQDREGIQTESQGERDGRHVVIRPAA